MNNYSPNVISAQIKESVDFETAASLYGLSFNRMGFAVCPFHNEKTPSFKVHNGYGHCFGCGWSGDIISFTKELFGLDFNSATKKLNDDFSLGLSIGHRLTLREQREAEQRRKELFAIKTEQEAKRKAYEDQYCTLWDEWCRLDKNRRDFAPKTFNEACDPRFVEALQKITYQEYLIDTVL